MRRRTVQAVRLSSCLIYLALVVSLAEVHQLCVIVFDFLKYGILLLRQRSGQFLLMANYQLCGNVVLTAAHDFKFMRSYVAIVEFFECGHCAHLPFQAQ